jgi:hypothetical protein
MQALFEGRNQFDQQQQSQQNYGLAQQQQAQTAAYQNAIRDQQAREFAQRQLEWNQGQGLRDAQLKEAQARPDYTKAMTAEAQARADNTGEKKQWGPNDTKGLVTSLVGVGATPEQVLNYGILARWMHETPVEQQVAAVARGKQMDTQRAMQQQLPQSAQFGAQQGMPGMMGGMAMSPFNPAAGMMGMMAPAIGAAASVAGAAPGIAQQQEGVPHAPDVPGLPRDFFGQLTAGQQAKIGKDDALKAWHDAQARAIPAVTAARTMTAQAAQTRAQAYKEVADQRSALLKDQVAAFPADDALKRQVQQSLITHRRALETVASQKVSLLSQIDWAKLAQGDRRIAAANARATYNGLKRDTAALEAQLTGFDEKIPSALLNMAAIGNPFAVRKLDQLAQQKVQAQGTLDALKGLRDDAYGSLVKGGYMQVGSAATGNPSPTATNQAANALASSAKSAVPGVAAPPKAPTGAPVTRRAYDAQGRPVTFLLQNGQWVPQR